MSVLLNVVAILGALVLTWLVYLLLFERGAFYRTNVPVHALGDSEKLRLLSALLGTPVLPVHSLHVLNEGPELYESQIAAIRAAKSSIHLEAYIFHPGRSADAMLLALSERASAGVKVRLIIDAIGSLRTGRSQFSALEAAGGRVYRYHPLRWHMFFRWNSRTHRNILVVDGRTGFVGGAGVADHWNRTEPAPWRDCVARVSGPVVLGLQAVFAENWLECAGEILAGGDSFPDPEAIPDAFAGMVIGSTPTAGRSTRARVLVQFLLASARHSIDLSSPYFVPDLGIRRELLAAKARGVRVRVVSGGPYSDHGLVRRAGRRRYGPLLEAGIEIWEYATHMLHVKSLVIDGRWCLLGSTNIDHRSFGLNDEVNLLVDKPALGAELVRKFERDLEASTLLDLAAWRRRPWRERILATLGRIIERHQ